MTPSLVNAKDEGLIVAVIEMRDDYRASKAGTVCVADELSFGRGDRIGIGNGIKGSILVIPEHRTVDLVGSSLGSHCNFTRITELRAVHCVIGTQLRDGLGG